MGPPARKWYSFHMPIFFFGIILVRWPTIDLFLPLSLYLYERVVTAGSGESTQPSMLVHAILTKLS